MSSLVKDRHCSVLGALWSNYGVSTKSSIHMNRTADQLGALHHLLTTGLCPYADFGKEQAIDVPPDPSKLHLCSEFF